MPLSDISKTNFVFKKIKGRRQTTNEKAWYEEFPGYLVFPHSDDIWGDEIPVPPPGVTTSVVEYINNLELTEDVSTNDHKAWLVCSTPGDTSTQLTGFVPPRFHQGYTARIFDDGGNEIPTTDPSNWLFDYENGVLIFEEDPTSYGWTTPIHITVYRYVGSTGADGNVQKLGAFLREGSQITVTGSSTDVTSYMTGKTPGGSETTTGVATISPNNYIRVLTYPDRDEIITDTGSRVYGRLTESGGTWTLSYYYIAEDGTETTYTFSTNTDIIFYYYEVLEFNDWPVFKEDILVTSDQITGDMNWASDTTGGKVLITNDGLTLNTGSNPIALETADERVAKITEWKVYNYSYDAGTGTLTADVKGGVYNANGDAIADTTVSDTISDPSYVLFAVSMSDGSIQILSDGTNPPEVPSGYFAIRRFYFDSTQVDPITNEVDVRPLYPTGAGLRLTLGIPTDGTYDDGLLDFTEDTYMNDAIDDINEVLKYLAPSDADPLTNIHWNTTFVTGKIPVFNTITTHGYLPAGTETNYITASNTFDGYNDPTATTFNKADLGNLEFTLDGSSVDTFDLAGNFNEAEREGDQSYPPATGAGNYLTITHVGWYNNFPLWQKGDVTIGIGSGYGNSDLTLPNDHRLTLTHHLDSGDQTATYDIFIDTNPDPTITTGPDITEQTPIIVELSGVKYYGLNSTFTLAFSADDVFKYTYLTQVSTLSGPAINNINYSIGDSGVTPIAEPPNDDDTFSVNTNITLDVDNVHDEDAKWQITIHKPLSDKGPYNDTETNTRLVHTYGTLSTDLDEQFVDENYRLPTTYNFDSYSSGITGQWDSTVGLTNGNAQVAGNLRYPTIDYTSGYLPSQDSDTDYSGFSGDQVYYRAYQDSSNPHSNGTLRFYGIQWADISSGNIKAELKLPTQTGWLDLSQQFNAATFTGADGDGCMTSYSDGSGYVDVSWSAGTFSTANSDYRYYLRITLTVNNETIDRITEIGW